MKVRLTIRRSLAGILSVPVALPVSKNVNFLRTSSFLSSEKLKLVEMEDHSNDETNSWTGRRYGVKWSTSLLAIADLSVRDSLTQSRWLTAEPPFCVAR